MVHSIPSTKKGHIYLIHLGKWILLFKTKAGVCNNRGRVSSDLSAGKPQKWSRVVTYRSDSEWFLLSTHVQWEPVNWIHYQTVTISRQHMFGICCILWDSLMEWGLAKLRTWAVSSSCLCPGFLQVSCCAEGLETFEKVTFEQSTFTFRRDDLPSSSQRANWFTGV